MRAATAPRMAIEVPGDGVTRTAHIANPAQTSTKTVDTWPLFHARSIDREPIPWRYHHHKEGRIRTPTKPTFLLIPGHGIIGYLWHEIVSAPNTEPAMKRTLRFHHDNHRLHSLARLLKIVSMNLRTMRALHQSPSWRAPREPSDRRNAARQTPMIAGLRDVPEGRIDGRFRPSNLWHFRVAPLDTPGRTETGLSNRKQSVTKVTTRHSYRKSARINLSILGDRIFRLRAAASAPSFAVRCHSERAQRGGISLRAPIAATTLTVAQRLLGDRSFGSGKSDGAKRLPLAVQFPRASRP
jgi:hypothetical protein